MPLKHKNSSKELRKGADRAKETDNCANHIQRLEEEKAGLLKRLRAVHSYFKKETENLKSQISTIRAEKDRASEDAEQLNLLSSAILALYVEVKDRKAARMTEELEAEAQRLACTNPYILLMYLRTHLRVVLSNQEDDELNLRDQIKVAQNDVARMENVLRNRLGEAESREAQVSGHRCRLILFRSS
jgi:predicted RNase H-like nuclease (RuvC/YqgF family)